MLILPLLQEQQGERVIGDRGYDCNELIDEIARYGSSYSLRTARSKVYIK